MDTLFKNNASGMSQDILTNVGNTLVLATGDGARFPDPTGNEYFLLSIMSFTVGKESAWEILKCTGRSGDTLTVQRGQENTAQMEWPAGSFVEHRLTAAQASDMLAGRIVMDGTTQTVGFNANAGFHYKIHTSGGSVIVTLPQGVLGDMVGIIDILGWAATNPIVLHPQTGQKIYSLEEDMMIEKAYFSGILKYIGQEGWYFV